jgi:hypothetical protein
MERTTEMLVIKSIDQIPAIEVLYTIPRSIKLKLVFENSVQEQRQSVGELLKQKLDGFVIGIHMNEPEINIGKIITDKEVEDNQLFFEKCARDYRDLATCLMDELNRECGFNSDNIARDVEIDLDSPIEIWEKIQIIRDKAEGYVGDWRYYMHGLHFCFKNTKTQQIIEVSIAHEEEYGVLDPYFFSQYIKSTKQYYPLPVEIYEGYWDGNKIIDKMIQLGRFELMESYIENEFVPVVANR